MQSFQVWRKSGKEMKVKMVYGFIGPIRLRDNV